MTPLAEPLESGRFLEIRRLHVASGDGRATERVTVACPRRREVVALDDCLGCDASGGVEHDPTGRTAYISCRAATGEEHPWSGESGPTLADRTPVASLMTTRVLAGREDVSVEALTEIFIERGVGGVPVVDAQGRPIGIVSKTDVLRERHDTGDTGESHESRRRSRRGYPAELGPGYHDEPPARTVADVMSRVAFTVSERASVAQVAALMAFEGIHRVPVVSDDGRVAGMVTTLDVLRWLAQQDGYLVPAQASLAARE